MSVTLEKETAKKNELLVDVQALEALQAQAKKDLEVLQNRRISANAAVDQAGQELKSIQSRIQAEENGWKQRQEKEYSGRESRLKARELAQDNRESLINARASAVEALEQERAEIDKKVSKYNQDSLLLERTRIQYEAWQQELAAKEGNQNGIAQAQDQTAKELARQSADLKQEIAVQENVRASNEARTKELDERETALKAATTALEENLKKFDTDQKSFEEEKQKVAAQLQEATSQAAINQEAEDKLLKLKESLDKRQSEIHAGEALLKKRQIDSIVVEKKLSEN